MIECNYERGAEVKYLDLFAGIGGFRLGLEQAGHECVGFCEIDKFARNSYKAINNTKGEKEYHDITKVSNEEWRTLRGTVELICGGFPCQSFSTAGKRKGFLDETRGTLFFEIARAAEQIKPRILFLENVRGLLSHDKGRTFRTILSTLNELGYDAEWQILNSKNFGVPQNRERVFIIGHLRGERRREVFPIRESNSETNDELKIKIVGNTNNLLKLGGIYTGTSDKFSSKPMLGLSRTLKANKHDAGIFDGVRIRKLTPRECWRLQGFPDWAFEKAQEVNSNSQLYKQAGNSVTVPVIYEIAKRFE